MNTPFNISKQWKDSFSWAFAILAGIETIVAVSSISFEKIFEGQNWLIRLLCIFVLFLIISAVTCLIKYLISKRGVTVAVGNNTVTIKQGDIFKADGWKVIAFNEYFDTSVGNIISSTSLNGIFIEKHVSDINDLNNIIASETDDNTKYKRDTKNSRDVFPLGRIIPYKDEYMLLAFSHFDNNNAHLSTKDYEHCLRIMWNEISRTYNNRPIFIPLLGSGITRFEDTPHNDIDLLKCLLCTLRTSRAEIKQPITILLKQGTLNNINLYELKGTK
ncbi:MAG: DUF6430 domain-containing protein [Prevotellaceae bacterium]|jgi:hypothetical protein|nr:DUF6430 domain-containing protein [Prevotellaceae bacterium]